MIVTTSKRTYHIRLRSHDTRYMARIGFSYPIHSRPTFAPSMPDWVGKARGHQPLASIFPTRSAVRLVAAKNASIRTGKKPTSSFRQRW